MGDGYSRLIKKIKKYNPNCDFALIEKAHNLSLEAHKGQQRESGDPFIVHPMEVANILADLELDCTAIVAGILHDIVEDTSYTIEQIRENFGDEVANLVDGVTKLGKIPYTTKEELQAENLRKMFLAMAKDIRVILIKLADRLHNMRTLKYMPPEKQIEKAKETLEIYAPLAHRLGISKIKWELEDLCLRYLDPKGYYDLVNKIAKKRREREAYISEIIKTIQEKTVEIGIDAHIEGRPKHFYSIYRKMVQQNKTIEQIYDLFAVRVIVTTVKDCYAVLGLVHEIFKPMPGRFKDYIAMPKPNMYQSLHTTLIGHEGVPFEVQIRTWEMHRVAEVGIAAHWKYKEGKSADDYDNKLAWLRQLLEWQKEMRDASEFMETLKIDLFTDEVFVFTPKGDVISLPAGSTPIDFAYAIHSAIGNKMSGAKVNNKIVPIDYVLQNGDIVEILTSSNVQGPSRDWLKIVKSSQAKNKINQWFKKEKREENIIRGKEMIEKELKKQGFTASQLFKPEWVDIILKKYTFATIEDLWAAIGYGALTANRVISRLKEEYRKTVKAEELAEQMAKLDDKKVRIRAKKVPENGVIVKGIENCLVRISRCCNPVPGDEIIGYITRGRGVSVHRKDCINIMNNIDGDNRLIEVAWYTANNVAYKADITIMAHDRTALLMEITNVIGEAKIPLKAINARTTKDQIAIMNLILEITNTEQLESIIKKIRKVDGVFEVSRNRQ
ncbi:MAG TPA: bifunctional (p)ppGpp synthetase/guanosine-3',5'-bis(diphosphate) 3'-pyrophosphohydrolase [Hungateiclostridium thermocellum]|uniref:GTP diphosphokinase n=1 Tax=Acetivibrio thermocellus (strain ATCC 27405 / DSM 1237 / JCM 9322 / NBRC 103400 / NCIMB 10682 / NRRL B-4536 / VPI 7372) TaxID=203119 RepID=A3DF47_ACET2|nr:bifunctional (p)ppGpp synthetase/guanosine-3',5'-bis(diphosphate) 3'-pyrophosphohydrolase [Acetivibrio thermocellus]CDG36019.1 GTP pyrophosphokinase [Acetivibrio thermocellus BC1]ABN52576.1 (p)ppGpp synthetase I, SpoT/RelA [Acetivibrio thermocellus ATCC 27405]NLU25737.1 bifunctional (p)ppGpp synthetase/guanosine-3',5'-bis(diphosphate) 3'-pyrophosphohydrolase [Acetivibrio thermocellus]THJ78913.1 bifunctional (p)ppGpp synthetase/guanosine-3',5'-bis(diphosphate) 3'-pyrophosphohydrolase [Acetivi